MPVYEFYCIDCHTIFNFLSRRVNTDRRPTCPRCGRPDLERQVSHFAISKGRSEEPAEGMPDLDEEKLEKAMMGLAGEMEGMDENDPRAMAKLMRRLQDATGMNLGTGFEEAMHRLEAGEDPEKVEEEMGDLFDGENLFTREGIRGLKRKYTPPAHDDTLYSFTD
ncbi:zinc ribbon domain-containing protein [Geobacter sp.]|uniref:FmdB family zinc ribbon protein n=1 Tax=Geobacter sp. TaxID=46610 RepID=UPI00260B3C75|nr:zinc ribbon domain-containing protein [Geobacter sp.]